MRIESQRPQRRPVYDGLLLVLLVLLLVGVLTFDRTSWPSLVGDEATYLMAAESLAWDGDLLYERRDFDRFVAHWQVEPEGLILQSGDGGRHITFGKPFFYPAIMAPLVRVWPTRGPFLANILLLAAAALVASRTLRQTLGSVAPLWVGAFLFASVAFAYTFWAHADVLLLALSALALGLALREPDKASDSWPRRGGPSVGRWALVGALLAPVVFSRPLYLPLFLPVVFALPRRGRVRAGAALVIGALAVMATAAGVHRATANAWTSYGAQRHGFYSSTGFPEVHFPAEEWGERVDDLGNAAWAEARTLTSIPPTAGSLWLWNGLYFVVGRYVGILPYFLPVVLPLLGRPRGAKRWLLLVAVALSVAGFFLYRPFNFYGGGGAIANRYFLPLYPAFWFMASRPSRPRRVLAVVLVAALFLWPLWSAPRAFPQRPDRTYRYAAGVAAGLLPYETTQSHLKPSGRSDVVHRGLWVKFLSPTLRPKRDGSALLLQRGERGQLLLGSNSRLSELELRVLEPSGETVRVTRGARVVEERIEDRGQLLRLELGRPRARHPMWWTWAPVFLYQLTLESQSQDAGRLTFMLRPVSTAGGRPRA